MGLRLSSAAVLWLFASSRPEDGPSATSSSSSSSASSFASAAAVAPAVPAVASPPSSLEGLVPLGPLLQVDELKREHILRLPQPLLLRSQKMDRVLKRIGLGGLDTLVEQYGDDQLLVSYLDGHQHYGFLDRQRASVRDFVAELRSGSEHLLPEAGGREFFLLQPDLYVAVASAYSRLLPMGFRDMLDVDSRADREALIRAAAEQDYGVSDLSLWLGGGGSLRQLHVDTFSGIMLTHIEGSKRVWLFPASQKGLLQLGRRSGARGWTVDEEGWGAQSSLKINVSSGSAVLKHPELFPEFAQATPLVIDLRPGETLFIPCGWAHMALYSGVALSVSTSIHPDWLEKQLKEDRGWAPENCSAWLREPCTDEGCGDWSEL